MDAENWSLSKADAVDFVSGKLQVGPTSEVLQALTERPLELVNRICRASFHHLAFQNVSLLASKERKVPTVPEILRDGLRLQGGVCFNLNVFAKLLLDALGYDTYLIGGIYTACGRPNNHVAVVVRGLDPSVPYDQSLHLVEVGCGFPTFEAVPLHRLPQTYRQVGLEFQYRIVDGRYVRLHRRGDAPPPDEVAVMFGEWRRVFDLEPTPRSLDFFPSFMETIFVVAEGNGFFESIRACRFPMTSSSGTDEAEGSGRVAVSRERLLLGSFDAGVETPLDDVADALRRHFVHIPHQHVRDAVDFLDSLYL